MSKPKKNRQNLDQQQDFERINSKARQTGFHHGYIESTNILGFCAE
jgi:hypothetical protein